ncbi:MAG TPA: LTA synthase family protein [Clostridia bacterium]|nr:LTA synthase family protein [Clostridia bacterium]
MSGLTKIKDWFKEFIKRRSEIIALVIFPIILVLITEFVHRGSLISAFQWVGQHKNEFFASYLIAISLITFIAAVTKKVNRAFFVILCVSIIFSLISGVKIKFRGEPLLPWDIILGKEAGNIMATFASSINLKIIFFMLFYFFVGFVLVNKLVNKLPQQVFLLKGKIVERIVLCVVSLALFIPIYYDKPIPIKQKLGIQGITWDQSDNYSKNGFLLSFLMNLHWLSAQEPSGYSKEVVSTIVQGIEPKSNSNDRVNPNIIMIMSEAFWDPTIMDNISFSRDPLPFFHSLQKKHTSGWLLVPIYGGGTVNTEFEVLTGNSMHFLPGGAIAYAQYVRKPIDSLASILARQGYESIAIHSYHNWFYRRNVVYKNLGFSKYISGEYFINPERKGDYVVDSEITKMIIEETEKSEDPVFIFAVTMQNHGPYYLGKSGENTIKVEGDLSKEAKDILETYIQGLADADKALKTLVNYFEKKKEPTIIVFFGDHLPSLGDDYKVYKEANFYKNDSSYEEYKRMYSTPFLIWSNYFSRRDNLNFNASFLGAYILDLANKEGNVYMDYLNSLVKSMPIIPPSRYYDQESIDQDKLEEYRKLQYDLLLGNGYLYQGNKPKIQNEQYFLGRERMTIKNVEPAKIKAGQDFNLQEGYSSLEVTGTGFTPACKIYFNGKPQPITFISQNCFTANVSKEFYARPGKLEIQVKLEDSMGKIIGESNKLIIEIEE